MDFFYQPASWVFIAFIIFISITIYLKVPNMVTKLLDEQISKIKNDLDDARKLKEDANSLLAEYERKIESANKEAENIINQAKNNAKSYEENSNKKVEEFILTFITYSGIGLSIFGILLTLITYALFQ